MNQSSPKKSSDSERTILSVIPVWGWLLLVAAVAGIGLLTRPDKSDMSDLPREVSAAEALKLREQGAFILDVREVSEWNEVHIPESTLIPLGELPSRLNEVPLDKQIVVVCRSGNRSQTGRDTLLRAGFTSVASMAGGVTDWKASGYPIVTGP